jgi:hypothetical protein
MTRLRLPGVVFAMLGGLVLPATTASASLVTYEFVGVCNSPPLVGDCALFDLSSGDPVTGSITFNDALVTSTDFTSILPTDPDLKFSFQFGNVSVDKSNLDPISVLRVMFGDPAGTSLIFQNAVIACINALFPCHVHQAGTEEIEIGTTLGSVTRNHLLGLSDTAYTLGSWTRVAEVPEPSAAILCGLGLAGLATRKRRSRR